MSTKILRISILPALLFAFNVVRVRAQDIHFSQFGNSPLNLNPALAGVFGGDLRAIGNYRSQWHSVPVPYNTISASVENKVYWKSGKYDRFFTGSLLLDYDRQGSISLTSIQVGFPISVTLPAGRSSFITVGATPTFAQRSFGTDKLTVDDNWNGDFFDPYALISEPELFQSKSIKYFDISAGANLRLQSPEKRTRMDIGGALHHINRPVHNFWEVKGSTSPVPRLAQKWTFHVNGLLQLTDNFDLMGQGIYQKQATYLELVYGLGIRMHLSRQLYKETAIQIGVDYRQRFRDALIPHVEFMYRTWQLGLSYDMNSFSDAEIITNGRGGPEISLIYRLYRVKPIPKYKSCQII